jgi:hypothetical protein
MVSILCYRQISHVSREEESYNCILKHNGEEKDPDFVYHQVICCLGESLSLDEKELQSLLSSLADFVVSSSLFLLVTVREEIFLI